MPRIDPEQLLKCLSVLLSSNGGIKSVEEVIRLVTLMLRFSKKLVSKCIYINILKCTETEILGSFMTAGGWSMTLTWLNEGIVAKNWPLVEEILKLLFLCPVDVERLKSNTFPRKVKALSKDASHTGVQYLAACLVDRWLRVVKGEIVPPLVASEIPVPPIVATNQTSVEDTSISDTLQVLCDGDKTDNESTNWNMNMECSASNLTDTSEVDPLKCGENSVVSDSNSLVQDVSNVVNMDLNKKTQDKKKSKDLVSDEEKGDSDKKSDHKSGKSRRHSSTSSNKSKESSRKEHDKKDEKDSSKKSSSREKSKENDREKDRSKEKHKSKHRSSERRSSDDKHREDRHKCGEDKHKSSSDRHKSSENKHKSSEVKSVSDSSKNKDSKNKDKSNSKLQTLSINGLGKIPKKSSQTEENETKKSKHSISIEVRKSNDSNRPKTVKTFHSKFRSHGLEEEAKPPPPRTLVKKPVAPTPPVVPPTIPKRTSSMSLVDTPPEKKSKLTDIEKPGSIKLIPPKPKPIYLQESVSFIDALTASAVNKKEPKKKKRKLSISRDTSLESSPPASPSTPQLSSPTNSDVPKSAPFKFYQDTLDSEENKETKQEIKEESIDIDIPVKESEKVSDEYTMKSPLMSPPRKLSEEKKITEEVLANICESEQIDPKFEQSSSKNGLKSILSISKSKSAKKSLRWRDHNLEEIQYFELDENERVNVTRTFLDMKQMERVNEREAFQKARNLLNDDLMGEQTAWRPLIPVEALEIEYGQKSREKDVQLARQKTVLQCLYLNKAMVPDTPAEPDFEQHQVTDPAIMPLDDVSGSADNVEDLSDRPWPEPKSYAPPIIPQGMVPPIYNHGPMPPFVPNFPTAMSGPVFPPGPGVMPNEWPMNNPGMLMPNGMNAPPDMFMGPNGPMFQAPMNGEFPMMENMGGMNAPMFPPNFSGPMGNMVPNGPMMNRPMGPNGPPFNNFQGNRGNINRGSNNRGGTWRGKGSWSGPARGGGGGHNTRGNTKRCIHFQKKGYCRQENNCHFAHI